MLGARLLVLHNKASVSWADCACKAMSCCCSCFICINCMFDEEHTVLNSYTTVHKQMFRVLSCCRSSRRVVLWSRLSLQIWHLMFLRMHGANSKVGSYGSSHHPVYIGTVCLHAAVALILEGLRIRVCPCTASDVYHATLGAASRNVLNVRRSLPHCGSHNS